MSAIRKTQRPYTYGCLGWAENGHIVGVDWVWVLHMHFHFHVS